MALRNRKLRDSVIGGSRGSCRDSVVLINIVEIAETEEAARLAEPSPKAEHLEF